MRSRATSKRAKREAAARAREREHRFREARGAWIASGVFFAIMIFGSLILGRSGEAWNLLWYGGTAICAAIASYRTVRWLRLR